jgi:peptidoglycan LD-endopeptidase CwlK
MALGIVVLAHGIEYMDTKWLQERSNKALDSLLPEVKVKMQAFLEAVWAKGYAFAAISGTRTFQEQDALYAQGGVTKARGGYSNHNFGLAVDLGLFDGHNYIPESKSYAAIAPIGRAMGLSWGGDWRSFQDEPHWQLRPEWSKGMSESAMLAGLRARKAKGLNLLK